MSWRLLFAFLTVAACPVVAAAQSSWTTHTLPGTDCRIVTATAWPEHAVRTLDARTGRIEALAPARAPGGAPENVTGKVCDADAVAFFGQSVPGGGVVLSSTFANSPTAGRIDRAGFVAQIAGSPRTEAIFAADVGALHPVVFGGGNGGGSGLPGNGFGDPTPIGGTFSGFFQGTPFAPGLNAAGDMLFIADVDGGSAPRGLFLYRAGKQDVVKIAAVGDASPAGGNLGTVGVGSLNDRGVVVFLATGATLSDEQILRWENGTLTKIARIGDPGPGGPTYTNLVGEILGFVDGTFIPTGAAPDINNNGDVCFRAGTTMHAGHVVVQGGVPQWYVRIGDPTPFGGTFIDFYGGANLNDHGVIAFQADFTGNAGWFVGGPGSFRGIVKFFDVVDGGSVVSMAVSRNPMTPLSNDGDLVLWVQVQLPNQTQRDWLVLGRANGILETVRGTGDPSPIGGSVGFINPWPSMNHVGQAAIGCTLQGVPNIFDAYLLFTLCPEVAPFCTAKPGLVCGVPTIVTSGYPSATSAGAFVVTAAPALSCRSGVLIYNDASAPPTPFPPGDTGTLCVAANGLRRAAPIDSGGTPGSVCDGAFAIDMNAFRAQSWGGLGGECSPLGRQSKPASFLENPGIDVFAQIWGRDSPATGSFVSSGVRWTVAP